MSSQQGKSYAPPTATTAAEENRAASGSSPTNVRYSVLVLTMLMSVILYLDRFAMSGVQKTIESDLGLNVADMGVIGSWFFYIYALAQVPTGWLAEKLKARWALTLFVLSWSLAMAGIGLSSGLITLCVFRSLLGLAQAGAYPCAASLVKCWFPLQRRGFANSTVAMGGRAGFLITTFLTPVLVLWVARSLSLPISPWRTVFLGYAAIGVVWAVAFFLLYRNSPSEHPRCNAAEVAFIAGPVSSTDSQNRSTPSASFVSNLISVSVGILTSWNVWLLCIVGVAVNAGWIFLVAYLPRFLVERHGLPEWQAGIYAALPGLASMIGGVCGGTATDFLVKRFGLKWGRSLTGMIAASGAAIMYLSVTQVSDLVLTICIFAAAGLLIDFGLGSLWAVYQDIAGNRVATMLGFANMCGNLAAGVFSTYYGKLAKQGEWNTIFFVSAAALVVMAVGWSLVNANKKIVFASFLATVIDSWRSKFCRRWRTFVERIKKGPRGWGR